jgi:2'-5' RNA ligase
VNLFLGMPISEQDIEILTNLILQEYPQWLKHRDIRWTPIKNHHLTLHFFGHIDPETLMPRFSELDQNLKSASSFSIKINKLYNFPKDNSNLVAAYLELNSALAHLYSQIEGLIQEWGMPVEDRPYLPHITLCRAKRRHVLNMSPIIVADFPLEMTQVVLYQTQNIQGVNHYLPLRQWRLVPQSHGLEL